MISVQLFDELPPNYSIIFAVFHLETCSEQAEKSDFFTQKVPKKVVKTGDPADTDIARKRSKREGYFSRSPKIKFQNTGKHTEVCHTHILLVKISKNPYVRDGTGRDGQADFAHSNVKGASATIAVPALGGRVWKLNRVRSRWITSELRFCSSATSCDF